MSTTVTTAAVILLMVAVVITRSVVWRQVTLSKLIRVPIVLGLFGVLIVAGTVESLGHAWRPSVTDLGVLGGELVLAVAAGWGMGRLSEFRTVDGVVASRLRPTGVAVFLGFVAVRVGVAVIAASIGGTPALMSATILVVIAVIKFTQGLVVAERYHAHRGLTAGPVVDQELSYR